VVARGAGASRGRRAGARFAGFGVVAAGAAVLLSGCSVDDAFHFGWPIHGVSEQSKQMYNLWIGSVIAALVVGVLVWGLIFWCIVRYRKRGEELPPQTRYNMPMELLYTVLPFLVIAVLFYYTATIEANVTKIPKNPDVTVDVVAFKWNWQFQYEGVTTPDGQKVSTIGSSDYIPVLVVPVHKTILFVESSPDVIHSFWVPELLFKRDVFPGNVTNKFAVTIDKEGAYVGHCAELCGTYHAMMNFELRAVSSDEYTNFLAAKQQGMSTPDALRAAGDPNPLATTTEPFTTDRSARNAS
jgi:cytochrome c oxidase subunit II